MPTVTFIAHDGVEQSVMADNGVSLMEAAVANDISGIDADCGGACACATCHVKIDAQWMEKLPPRAADEESMLSLAVDVTDASRLACQVNLGDALEGLRVQLPESQY